MQNKKTDAHNIKTTTYLCLYDFLYNTTSAPIIKHFILLLRGRCDTKYKYKHKYKCVIYNPLIIAKEMKLIHYFCICAAGVYVASLVHLIL